MGLHVSVYKSANKYGDTSNNGISNRYDTLCVVNVEGPFVPNEQAAPVLLVDDAPTGTPYPKLVPAVEVGLNEWEPAKGWHMFGGSLGVTSDDRLDAAVKKLTKQRDVSRVALPIHDRVERF